MAKGNTSPQGDKNIIKDLEKRVADLEDKWKRALADYINLERRFKEDKEQLSTFIKKIIILELLPVYDSLLTAGAHDQGCALICRQFADSLSRLGVEEIKADKAVFDPALHEAVEAVPGKKGVVLSVVAPGFKIGDEVIRPARVRVGKG